MRKREHVSGKMGNEAFSCVSVLSSHVQLFFLFFFAATVKLSLEREGREKKERNKRKGREGGLDFFPPALTLNIRGMLGVGKEIEDER